MQRSSSRHFVVLLCAVLLASIGLTGCKEDVAGPGDKAVVYCSVDEVFGRVVLKAFSAKTGIEIEPIFDSEAGKTTGLVQRLEQEAGQPRADVFFSSELFNTILLARKGVLEKYDPATAEDIPDRYRDSERRWTAIGLRARVLAYDLELTPPSMLPTSWEELAKPQYATNLAFANPLFGTTRGHVAAMFAGWGSQRAKAFLTGLRDNGAFITDSNSAALRAVLAFRSQTCATDTDDVYLARTRQGADDLDLRHLDMGDGGTLLIPFSVALIKGGPNPKAGKRLVDFLVSEEVERMLAQSDSHNIPVRALLREELNMILPPESNISYDKIADHMDEAVQAVREILIR